MFKIKMKTQIVNTNKMGEPVNIGDWKKEKELGSGGFGTVSLWMNKVTCDYLAIKKCKWNLETHLTPKQRERWCSEVKMMQRIHHKNIVSYRKIPEELETTMLSYNPSNLPILSMEYCSLGNLRDILCNTENCCGLPEAEVIQILKDISNALFYLHELNITHRDVKPENIVVQVSDTNRSAVCYKLIDLGYAKELSSHTVSFVGTLQYLAPEIFSKESYTASVDYWSLGITAFEIICGTRPFLPTFTNVQCYQYLVSKEPNVICIQFTHTGDIKSTSELPKENQLNACLKQDIEKWLKSVLEFDSEKRGVIVNNQNVFQYLDNILSKKIITVFSIYTYEYYSYEVNDSTLFSTMQNWIARDVNIQKSDQYLIATNNANSNYAKDYFDENNLDAMLFVMKRGNSINKNIQNILPKLITIMFQNMKKQFKCGTLKLLHAQMIFYILSEMKHHNCLCNSIVCVTNVLKTQIEKEMKFYIKLKTSLEAFLREVEFYNIVERSSLCNKVNKNTNNQLEDTLLEYQNYMCQLKEIVNIANLQSNRFNRLIAKNKQLQLVKNILLNQLENYDFSPLLAKAKDHYNEFLENVPNKVLTGSPYILKVVSGAIKIRDKLLNDKLLLNFLRGVVCCYSELSKVGCSREAVQNHLNAITHRLRQIIIERLQFTQDLQLKNDQCKIFSNNGLKLITANTSLRYKLQELMNTYLMKYKEIISNENEISHIDIQNGEY